MITYTFHYYKLNCTCFAKQRDHNSVSAATPPALPKEIYPPSVSVPIFLSYDRYPAWLERMLIFKIIYVSYSMVLEGKHDYVWTSVGTGVSILEEKIIYAILASSGYLLRRFSCVIDLEAVFVWTLQNRLFRCIEWEAQGSKDRTVKYVEKKKPSDTGKIARGLWGNQQMAVS